MAGNAVNINASIQAAYLQVFSLKDARAYITTAAIIRDGAVPESIIHGGRIIDNWGGRIRIGPAPIDGYVAIAYHRVPRSECIAFIRGVGARMPYAMVRVGDGGKFESYGKDGSFIHACRSGHGRQTVSFAMNES